MSTTSTTHRTRTHPHPHGHDGASAPAHPIGLTRDAGWELGVRRTLPLTRDQAWELLRDAWLPRWLDVDAVPLVVGAELHRGAATVGRVVGAHLGRRLRVRWDQPDIDGETVLQVTLIDAAGGTTVAIHQERLGTAEQREDLLERWTAELDALRAEAGAAPADDADLVG